MTRTSKQAVHLYLDIDGVLNAYAALFSEPRYRAWPDYRPADPNDPYGEIISPFMVGNLNALIVQHGITCHWLTSWEDRAGEWGQNIGLLGSEAWPWLDTGDRDGEWGKFATIREHLDSTRPARAIWIDDDLKDEHQATLWAAERGVLALAPYGAHGITPAMIRQIHEHIEAPPILEAGP